MKSPEHPGGFDYAGTIHVLDKPVIALASEQTSIQVQSNYPGSECGHMTTLSIPEQRVFLGFDLLYNRVHAWCGPGVGKGEIGAWIQALDAIQERTAGADWTFCCGHGGEGHHEVIRNMKAYLQTFVEITSAAESRLAAIERMKDLFPGFAQDDFLWCRASTFMCRRTLRPRASKSPAVPSASVSSGFRQDSWAVYPLFSRAAH